MIKYIISLLCCSLILSCAKSNIEEQDDNTNDPSIPDDDTPEFTYSNIECRKISSGAFEAWTKSYSTQTITVDGLNWFSQVDSYTQTAWGGRLDYEQPTETIGTNGFFRVGRSAGRWYFLDPAGGAVILHGTQHVRLGESDEHQNSFASKFGTLDKWGTETAKLLSDNGINYISYGSNRVESFPDEVRDNLLNIGSKKMAYAENLYLLRTFMWDMYSNLGYSFQDGTYNRMVLAFEPTFQSYVEALAAEKCEMFKGDEHFVGYYIDNELPFVAYNNADEVRGIELQHFLSLPDIHEGARSFAENFMTSNNISSESAITEAHRSAFRTAVADHYFKITTDAIRKADPDHLILGVRLHDWSKYTQGIVETCAKYCDVVSLNYYARWEPEQDYMANLALWSADKPFIVTEFYVKGDDACYNGSTYPNTEGGGWLVRSQEDRGVFYQNFCLRLLQSKQCAGWMHFEYNDGGGIGAASNKGIVSLEYEPYTDFTSAMKQLHTNIYPLINYFDK